MKNLPFLDRKKSRFQLKSYSIFNANNPYMVVTSLHFVLRINSPRSLSLHRWGWKDGNPRWVSGQRRETLSP